MAEEEGFLFKLNINLWVNKFILNAQMILNVLLF